MAAAVPAVSAGEAAETVVHVDASKEYQVIQGFGAACSFWRRENEVAYRSPEFQKLLINDLGLSILRFEVNPGLQQEPDLDADALDLSRFDFNALKTAGQLAQALSQRAPGQVKVICSIWSPPAWMKTNNATRGGGNLRTDRYAQFAKYCAGLCLGFEKTYGVPVYAMSLQNELVFVEPYDSCVYSPETIRDVTRTVGEAFKKWKVSTKLMGNEDVGCGTWFRYMQYAKPTLDDAGQYLSFLCIHGYAGDGKTPSTNRDNWTALRRKLEPYRRELWMTETSGDPPDTWAGGINVATHIHEALVYGGCSAWVYWQLTNPFDAGKESLCVDGAPTPKYYAVKHYARFVRPGAIQVSAAPDSPGLGVSAFVHKKDRTITVVLINSPDSERPVQLDIQAPWEVASFERYVSSAREMCATQPPLKAAQHTVTLTLPRRSIVTLVGRG